MKKLLAIFLLIPSLAFAQGFGTLYPKLKVETNGSTVAGSGTTLNFTGGTTVNYSNNAYNVNSAGLGMGSVIVVHNNGTSIIYNPAADTDQDRGTALLNAVAAAVDGDTIYLAANNYDIGNNGIDEGLGGNGIISIYGAGQFRTTIYSSYANNTTEVIIQATTNSVTSDLGVVCTAASGVSQVAYGAFNTSMTNPVLKNFYGQCGADVVYFNGGNVIGARISNLVTSSNFDSINFSPNVGDLSVYDTNLVGAAGNGFTSIVRGIVVQASAGSTGQVTVNSYNLNCSVNGGSTTNHCIDLGSVARANTVNLYSGTLTSSGTGALDLTAPGSTVINVSPSVKYSPLKISGNVNTLNNPFYLANNVGVGSISPIQKLDVQGTVRATQFNGNGGGLFSIPSVYGTQYHSFGDSITYGYSADPLTLGYAYLISNDLGTNFTDYAVAFSTSCDVVEQQIFPNENPGNAQNSIYTMMDGINDAVNGTGNPEIDFNLCHQASITWLTIPSTSKVFGQARTSVTGSWANGSEYGGAIGINSHTNGSTATFNITTYGNPIYIWYRKHNSDGGTFTYTLDGGSASSTFNTVPAASYGSVVNNGFGVALIRIPNVTAGSHTLVFTVTSSTSASNNVYLESVGTPAQYPYLAQPTLFVGGITPYPGTISAPTLAAYNADVVNNVSTLSNDGLNAHYVNVNNYFNSSTDLSANYAPGPHPNNLGHQHLRDAFESVMQFVYQDKAFLASGVSNINTPSNFVINGTSNFDSNTALTVNGNSSSQIVNQATYGGIITTAPFFTPSGADPVGEFLGFQFGLGQKFVLGASTVITGADILWSLVSNSPTGTGTVKIQTNNAGVPSGTLANANATLTVTFPTVPSIQHYTFTPFVLAAGTYWLTAEANTSQSSGNAWEWAVQNPAQYSQTSANELNGTWATAGWNKVFAIYGIAGSTVPTVTPSYLLTGNNSTLSKIQANSSANTLSIINNGITSQTIDGNGNVGIGSLTPGQLLDIKGTLRVLGNGNVGIGTASPGKALDIQGTARMTGFQLTGNGASSGFVMESNSVGIGTWVPAPSGGGGASNWIYTSSGNIGLSTTANVGIGTTFTSSSALTVMNGNVGIGTWVPAESLDVVNGLFRVKKLVGFDIGPRMILDNSAGFGQGSLDFYTIGGSNPNVDIPSARWHVIDDGNYSGNQFFESKTTGTGGGQEFPWLTIISSGAVGVGSGNFDSPQNSFDIDTSNLSGSLMVGAEVDGYAFSNYCGAVNGACIEGNVNIGSNFDNGYPLYVNGVGYFNGSVTSSSWITSGGTSSQFVKGDGSLDSSTYLTTSSATSTYVPYSGATGTVNLNAKQLINVGNVGIGSLTPGQKLDVQGTIRGISGGSCTTIYKCNGGVDVGVIQTSACSLCPGSSCVAMNGCF